MDVMGGLPAGELRDELVLILCAERMKGTSDHTWVVQLPGRTRC